MVETSIISPCDDIFVDRLRNTVRKMNPVVISNHGKTKFYVNPSLKTCSYVFLRVNSVKHPLCQPYTGSHKVLKRNMKTNTTDLNGRKSIVSISRVMPAYLIPPHENQIPTLPPEKGVNPKSLLSANHQYTPHKTGRDGRRVYFPSKLAPYITY
ncbi:retrovirus-related Pol polyprotein from transposon 412 [Trichonephila clavipes]|nr:retrovirus-related Pol polyprotein from transposon 412 [Trichonephila clavipes]